ncbi:MAG: ABC transporter permease [Defluviitaleaceae bacterium]|nr:ABC transporter permease [Defluviitaleaceae bacterium]
MFYIFKKIAISILTIFLISIFVFFMFQVIPGDPVLAQLGIDGIGDNPLLAENLREAFEMDVPVVQRYVNWAVRVVGGDLGESFQFRTPVAELIASRLPQTFSLALTSLAAVIVFGIPLGIFLANHGHKKQGVIVSILSQIFIALPSFWFAILLIWIFAFHLNFGSMRVIIDWGNPANTLRDLTLPVAALSLGAIAIVARYVKASVLEQKNSEYVTVALAKGMTESQVMRKHILRNSLIPILTILGLTSVGLFTGSIVIENVFTIQGIGSLLINAINFNDYPLIQGIVLYFSVIVVALGLFLDMLHVLIDPRIKRGWK